MTKMKRLWRKGRERAGRSRDRQDWRATLMLTCCVAICAGKKIRPLKRLPKDPKAGYIVKAKKQTVNVMCAVPYELLA